jgi:hypothetical protein
MAEVPHRSNDARAEQAADELDLVCPADFVKVASGGPDWFVSVASPGKEQLVARCPYRAYAVAVGAALAYALDCRMGLIP